MDFESKPLKIDKSKVEDRLHPCDVRNIHLIFLSLQFPCIESAAIATLKEFIRRDGHNEKQKGLLKI